MSSEAVTAAVLPSLPEAEAATLAEWTPRGLKYAAPGKESSLGFLHQ